MAKTRVILCLAAWLTCWPLAFADELYPSSVLREAFLPRIEFLAPPARAELGTWQLIRFRLSAGGLPLPWRLASVSTETSDLSTHIVLTDKKGIGSFFVRSFDDPPDTLTVRMDAATATLDIGYFQPTPGPNTYIDQYPMSYDDRQVSLPIEKDRIGVLTALGVTPDEVAGWAQPLDLVVLESPGHGLYTLGTQGKFSQNSRWELARQLKQAHGSKIVSAGLVTRPGASRNPVVMDDTLYVRFEPDTTGAAGRLASLQLDVLEQTPYGINEFIAVRKPGSSKDPLESALELTDMDDVIYAHPDVAQLLTLRIQEDDCSDPANSDKPWCSYQYTHQWHLENTGENGALEDADIDARKAWGITQGSPDTLIAIIDFSFHIGHPDLAPNLHSNLQGTNLVDCANCGLLWDDIAVEGPHPPSQFRHGTNVAGLAAARGGNENAVGVCPKCEFLPIRIPAGVETGKMLQAFDLAIARSADVVSMSLGLELTTANIEFATEAMANDIDAWKNRANTAAKEVPLVVSMSNEHRDNCQQPGDSSSLPDVIAVGGLTDMDRFNKKPETAALPENARGYGDCMDVMAFAGEEGEGNGIATSNVIMQNGVLDHPSYDEFTGTSAATPMVAGTAALILDASRDDNGETTLSPGQVKWILQDTADKVEPEKAGYDPHTGFSATGPKELNHAWGRINAYEATRLVATSENNNRDLFLRDNELDWGNTEQPSHTRFSAVKTDSVGWERERIATFESPDIRIDRDGDQFPAADEISAKDFSLLVHESPEPEKKHHVFVRLHNRGQQQVDTADLTLYWTVHDRLPAGQLPASTCDTADMFTATAPCWHNAGTVRIAGIAYSGPSLAGCPERLIPDCPDDLPDTMGQARVVKFELPDWVAWDRENQQVALLATVHSADQDPLSSPLEPGTGTTEENALVDYVTTDNNVTLWMEPEPRSEESDRDCWKWGLGGAILLLLLLL